MADQKFSDFNAETDLTDFDGIVGFQSATIGGANANYYISPSNLYTTIASNISLNTSAITAGTLPVARGGTGLGSISTLQNANVNYASNGTGILPADHGGTGVAGAAAQKVWSAVQQFVWTNGNPIAYTNITNNTGVYLPFDTTATIDVSTNTAANTKWTAVNSAQGVGGLSQQCTFTLGADGGGTWLIQAMIPMFDLDDNTTARLALQIDASEIAIFEHNWQAGRTGVPANSLYGNLTYTFSGGEDVKLLFYGNGGGTGFYPAGDSVTDPFFNTRPPEITFTRIV